MRSFKILCIIGARPNFIKISPLLEEMAKYREFKPIVVHTGQHYDYELSKIFFRELNISNPDYSLKVGSGSQASQTARIMMKLDPLFLKEKPDLTIVVGDVNSTLAGAIVAAKLRIPLAHIEAGLRSFDRSMPEEINRLLTDQLSTYLFVTEPSAIHNLLREGIKKEKIFYVGNIMIDSLLRYRNILQRHAYQKFLPYGGDYILLTLHRQENVDNQKNFKGILGALEEVQKKIKIIWPIHPRTKKQLRKFRFFSKIRIMRNLILLSPLGYFDNLSLMRQARLILTDSGGIQEEATVLGIPCLTLRETTERPITVKIGTNQVVGLKKERIVKESFTILAGNVKKAKIPKFWDGKTAQRIARILLTNYKNIR